MGQLTGGRCLARGSLGRRLLPRFTKLAANFLAGICTLTDFVVGIVEGEGKVTFCSLELSFSLFSSPLRALPAFASASILPGLSSLEMALLFAVFAFGV